MLANTQIGGKYHQDDSSLFRLKRILQSVGVAVSHPIADHMVYSSNGQGFAFDPTKMSFYDVETDYYNSIAASDFHTVNNTFLANKGYVGESAALEIAYAMLHHKPVVLMHPMRLKDGIDDELKILLLRCEKHLEVYNIHELAADAITSACTSMKGRTVDYGLTVGEESFIAARVAKLLTGIKNEAQIQHGLSA